MFTRIDAREGSAKKMVGLTLSVFVGIRLRGVPGLVHGLTKDSLSGQRTTDSAAYGEFASLPATASRELPALPRGIVGAARLRRRS